MQRPLTHKNTKTMTTFTTQQKPITSLTRSFTETTNNKSKYCQQKLSRKLSNAQFINRKLPSSKSDTSLTQRPFSSFIRKSTSKKLFHSNFQTISENSLAEEEESGSLTRRKILIDSETLNSPNIQIKKLPNKYKAQSVSQVNNLHRNPLIGRQTWHGKIHIDSDELDSDDGWIVDNNDTPALIVTQKLSEMKQLKLGIKLLDIPLTAEALANFLQLQIRLSMHKSTIIVELLYYKIQANLKKFILPESPYRDLNKLPNNISSIPPTSSTKTFLEESFNSNLDSGYESRLDESDKKEFSFEQVKQSISNYENNLNSDKLQSILTRQNTPCPKLLETEVSISNKDKSELLKAGNCCDYYDDLSVDDHGVECILETFRIGNFHWDFIGWKHKSKIGLASFTIVQENDQTFLELWW